MRDRDEVEVIREDDLAAGEDVAQQWWSPGWSGRGAGDERVPR